MKESIMKNMSLEELLGLLSSLSSFGGREDKKENNLCHDAIGKYVIVRSRNEGINFGYLVGADENGCVIKEARRIWYHKPADSNTAWYEGVAVSGLDKSSKVSCAVEVKYIVEDYSVTICTEMASISLREHPSHGS